MVEGKYDKSSGMSAEDIARDEALHKLNKAHLKDQYASFKKEGILSPKAFDAICTIISENNDNILKAIHFSRH
jgi:hypothetical protein